MADNPFAPATKRTGRAKIAITGVAGSGKTYTALQIARGLVGAEGRIAVGDAENGASRDYAGDFKFDTLQMFEPFNSGKLIKLIQKAAEFEYDVLVVDGISPFWEGSGGVLDIVGDNQAAAGGWAKGRPHANAIDNAILTAPMHLICTVRAKADTAIQPDAKGKMRPVQVGMKPSMSKDTVFVFGFMFYVDHETHALQTTKTRWRAIDGQILDPKLDLTPGEVGPAEEMGQSMRAWLSEGVDEAPETPPAAQTPPSQSEPAREGDVPFTPPAGQATGDGGLLDPAATQKVEVADTKALTGILARIAELKALDDSKDWVELVQGKFTEWFGREMDIAGLSATEAGVVAERLDSTIITLKARKEQA